MLQREKSDNQRLGERVALLAGVVDLIVESRRQGATNWVARLANALPHEPLRLFDISMEREGWTRARDGVAYDALPAAAAAGLRAECVQLVKRVQAELGRGNAIVRPLRRELEGTELDLASRLIRTSLGRGVA